MFANAWRGLTYTCSARITNTKYANTKTIIYLPLKYFFTFEQATLYIITYYIQPQGKCSTDKLVFYQ